MNARKLSDYYRAIADAEDALAACPKSVEDIPVAEKSDPAQEYRDAVVSARNLVLANDPATAKGELLGTLSTGPVIMARDLEDLGLEAGMAAELIASRDELRAAALSIAPIIKK